MKKTIVLLVSILVMCCVIGAVASAEKAKNDAGAKEFKEHCSMCHPDGGNVVNPKKTLHKSDREANNVKTEADIIKIMRNPGPGMTTFDKKTISDAEAKEIAKYILKTFK